MFGKPGNVRDFTENQGIVREKSCQGKVAIQVFSRVCCVLNVKYMVSDHVLLQFLPLPLTVTLVRA